MPVAAARGIRNASAVGRDRGCGHFAALGVNDRHAQRSRLGRAGAWPHTGPRQSRGNRCAQGGPQQRPGEHPFARRAKGGRRAGYRFGRACVTESARNRLLDFEPHVADVAQPSLRILLESIAPSSRVIGAGVSAGNAVQSGSRVTTGRHACR